MEFSGCFGLQSSLVCGFSKDQHNPKLKKRMSLKDIGEWIEISESILELSQIDIWIIFLHLYFLGKLHHLKVSLFPTWTHHPLFSSRATGVHRAAAPRGSTKMAWSSAARHVVQRLSLRLKGCRCIIYYLGN